MALIPTIANGAVKISNIDPTKPESVLAYTQNMRVHFDAIKTILDVSQHCLNAVTSPLMTVTQSAPMSVDISAGTGTIIRRPTDGTGDNTYQRISWAARTINLASPSGNNGMVWFQFTVRPGPTPDLNPVLQQTTTPPTLLWLRDGILLGYAYIDNGVISHLSMVPDIRSAGTDIVTDLLKFMDGPELDKGFRIHPNDDLTVRSDDGIMFQPGSGAAAPVYTNPNTLYVGPQNPVVMTYINNAGFSSVSTDVPLILRDGSSLGSAACIHYLYRLFDKYYLQLAGVSYASISEARTNKDADAGSHAIDPIIVGARLAGLIIVTGTTTSLTDPDQSSVISAQAVDLGGQMSDSKVVTPYISELFVQPAHGLTDLQQVYQDSTTGMWSLASAITEDTRKLGMVIVKDLDNIEVVFEGYYDYKKLHGFALDTIYYLDSKVAGSVVTAPPANNATDIVQECLIAPTDEVIYVFRSSVSDPSDLMKGWFNPTIDEGGIHVPFKVIDNSFEYKENEYLIAEAEGNYDFDTGLVALAPAGVFVSVGNRVRYDGTLWSVVGTPRTQNQGWFDPTVDNGYGSVPYDVINGSLLYLNGDYAIAIETGFYNFELATTDPTDIDPDSIPVVTGDRIIYVVDTWIVQKASTGLMKGWFDPTMLSGGPEVEFPIINGTLDYLSREYVTAVSNGKFSFITGNPSTTGIDVRYGDNVRYNGSVWSVYDDVAHNQGWMDPSVLNGGPTVPFPIVDATADYSEDNYFVARVDGSFNFATGTTDSAGEFVKAGDRVVYDGALWYLVKNGSGLMKGWMDASLSGGGLRNAIVDATVMYGADSYVIVGTEGTYDLTTGLVDVAGTLLKVGDRVRYDGAVWSLIRDDPSLHRGFFDATVNGGGALVTYPVINASNNYWPRDFVRVNVTGIYNFVTGLTAIKGALNSVELVAGDLVRYDGTVWLIEIDERFEGGVNRVTETIDALAHGLSKGQNVYKDATGTWSLARADIFATLKQAMVSEVIDANEFVLTYYGIVDWVSHGFTLGATYSLSDLVAGDNTDSLIGVDGIYSQATFEVIDVDTVKVLDQAVDRISIESIVPDMGEYLPGALYNLGDVFTEIGTIYRVTTAIAVAPLEVPYTSVLPINLGSGDARKWSLDTSVNTWIRIADIDINTSGRFSIGGTWGGILCNLQGEFNTSFNTADLTFKVISHDIPRLIRVRLQQSSVDGTPWVLFLEVASTTVSIWEMQCVIHATGSEDSEANYNGVFMPTPNVGLVTATPDATGVQYDLVLGTDTSQRLSTIVDTANIPVAVAGAYLNGASYSTIYTYPGGYVVPWNQAGVQRVTSEASIVTISDSGYMTFHKSCVVSFTFTWQAGSLSSAKHIGLQRNGTTIARVELRTSFTTGTTSGTVTMYAGDSLRFYSEDAGNTVVSYGLAVTAVLIP